MSSSLKRKYPDFMYGQPKLHTIMSFGETYQVDLTAYLAVSHQATLESSIEIRIDGVDYPRATEKIIAHIYFASLGIKYEPEPYHWTDTPADFILNLGVFSWCADKIHPSEHLLREHLREQIVGDTKVLRAILCKNTAIVGGVSTRRELLEKAGFPFRQPKIGEDLMLVPVNHGNDNNAVARLNALANSYIVGLQAIAACYASPNFKRVDNFGPECANIVRSLCSLDETDCLGHVQIDICDVYRLGLAKAFRNACVAAQRST